MAVCWVILRGQEIYTVIQAVHSWLYMVAMCNFFSVATETVNAYIKKCIDDVTVTKTITTHANQKPWMTAKERASSTEFLGVHITENLTWTTNTMSLKKAQQCLHFLRRLKRASLLPPILTTFYRGTIESVLTSCITVWYGNCSAIDCKTLQRTVNTAAKFIVPLSPPSWIFSLHDAPAKQIVKDPTHPSHSLFQILPSGWLYRSIKACSARLLYSFFAQAVRALNSNPPDPLWNPIQTPDLLKHGPSHNPPPPPPPTLPHHRKKLPNFFCTIQSVLHRWVGLYKPPVETQCPLFALDTFHTLLCVLNPTKDSVIYVYLVKSCQV